jgi:hypothetical protein
MGVDLLRARPDRDPPLKCAMRAAGRDPLKYFTGFAALGEMIDRRDDIGLLAPRRNKSTVESAMSAFALAAHDYLVAQGAAAE